MRRSLDEALQLVRETVSGASKVVVLECVNTPRPDHAGFGEWGDHERFPSLGK
ncbi:MAG: hypothetical protein IPG05_12640 [Gemmatimonadetes bacterium]|nr:hypothetical protein [Gemmatimonadota bacterium]